MLELEAGRWKAKAKREAASREQLEREIAAERKRRVAAEDRAKAEGRRREEAEEAARGLKNTGAGMGSIDGQVGPRASMASYAGSDDPSGTGAATAAVQQAQEEAAEARAAERRAMADAHLWKVRWEQQEARVQAA